MFKLLILSESQKKLKTQTLLMAGMMVSSMAVLISLFNLVMCAQNEFDPIVLETEMELRREKARQVEAKKLSAINAKKRKALHS